MAAVREHLLLNFAVENVHTALSPALGFLEFREEGTCHKHTLSLEEKVVALLGPVVGNVVGVAVVVNKELGEELRSEGRRVDEELELHTLVLQTVTHFERPPGIAGIFCILLKLGICIDFIFGLVNYHERVLANPVDVLFGPFHGVFFITAGAVCKAHRHKPFVAVQLPAEFVVLNRPIAPIDVFAIEIRRLVTLVGEELVLQGLVSPFLLFLVDFHLLDITDIRCADALAVTVVVQKGSRCGIVVTALMCSLNAGKSGSIEIQKFEDFRLELRFGVLPGAFLGAESRD